MYVHVYIKLTSVILTQTFPSVLLVLFVKYSWSSYCFRLWSLLFWNTIIHELVLKALSGNGQILQQEHCELIYILKLGGFVSYYLCHIIIVFTLYNTVHLENLIPICHHIYLTSIHLNLALF